MYLTFVSLGISKRYLKYHGTRFYGEGLAKLITAANLQLVAVFCCLLFVCFIIYFVEGEGANVVIYVTMSTTKESEFKTFRQDADCSFTSSSHNHCDNPTGRFVLLKDNTDFYKEHVLKKLVHQCHHLLT